MGLKDGLNANGTFEVHASHLHVDLHVLLGSDRFLFEQSIQEAKDLPMLFKSLPACYMLPELRALMEEWTGLDARTASTAATVLQRHAKMRMYRPENAAFLRQRADARTLEACGGA